MTNRLASRLRVGVTAPLLASVLLIACGSDDSAVDSLTIIAYDSFTPPDGAFDEFTRRTGIEVEVASAGDTGEMVAKAALTAGNPEGDVIWGVDNTLLSRAIAAEVFEPYVSEAAPIDPDLISTSAGVVTPVDFGDVCVNYDIAALDALGIAPPRTWSDLAEPDYANLLVTPSASASSVGLAFLLASIAEFGNEGWSAFWTALMDNGALVVDGWTEAYYSEFTRYGGTRPLVVSYATSPPAEVIFADPPLVDDAPAPTAIVEATCFRQIEYVGVLRGTEHPEEARELIDFLVGVEFQTLLPESIFVLPSNEDVELPPSFERYAVIVEAPLTMDATTIEDNRQRWVEDWTRLVG